MPILTPRRFAAGFLSAAVLAVPAAIVGTAPAHAEAPKTPSWTKHDKKVMKAANKACKKITDDVTYEFCVIGAFHLNDADSSSRRVITVEDYTYGKGGKIVLLQADGSRA